jgi:putative membrane-bound dehydrogenase-like protein
MIERRRTVGVQMVSGARNRNAPRTPSPGCFAMMFCFFPCPVTVAKQTGRQGCLPDARISNPPNPPKPMSKSLLRLCALAMGACLAVSFVHAADAPKKKIALVAGPRSHGPGEHEFNAGVLLWKKCLANVPGLEVVDYHNGWPQDPHAFDGANAIVVFSDGGGGHPMLKDEYLQQVGELMKKGAGLGCVHYAVEPTKEKGEKEFLDWIGGAFEVNWSVNPTWEAEFTKLPDHPVTRGVKPFKIKDEWYFHMRFRDGMKGVTPILSAVAPESTMSRKDGAHEGNPAVREAVAKGEPQHMMWVCERADGGRGFGFTGAHYHKNWGEENFRRVVLNAILWIAKMEVPANGVQSMVTEDDLQQNLDPKPPKKTDISPGKSAIAANGTRLIPLQLGAGVPAGGDVKPIYSSPVVHTQPVTIKADLTGAKELYLVVTDAGDGFTADWAVWLEPVLVKSDGTKINLTDLKPKLAHTGWNQLGVNKNPKGDPIKVKGQTIANGFGAHAPSVIAFDLPAGVAVFEARGAIDDGGTMQGSGATVMFQLYAANPGQKVLTPSQTASNTATKPHGPEAAKEFLQTVTVAPGLAAELFASEPMMVNPTDMDIDERGRVWICEGANYRKWANPALRPEGDRILILEDTNGDGEADKATIFYQGTDINAALGICVLGNKVIVSSAPNVFIFTNEGDKAVKKEVFFTGISGVQHDHAVHAFVFGPDGKLYFNMGNAGKQLKRPDGSPVIDLEGNEVSDKGKPYRDGMVFRCNFDGSEFETLGCNFRNNYEVCVDSFGNLWQSDNDDDGNKGVRINYVMEHGNFGYKDEMTGAGWQAKRTNMEEEIPRRHWHQNDPGVIPNLLQTGAGSPTGICVYEGKLLPQVFQNQVIHCDAGPRVVRAYPVKNDGAGFKAEMAEIMTSSDSWFRPSDCCVAPDGSLFVADWYDPGVGGHAMGDHDISTMRGRVFRIAPPGTKYSVPKPDFSTAAGCAQALQSPNQATRYLAWTKLHEMQDKAAGPLLDMFNKNPEPRMRARALQLLARIKGSENNYVATAIKDQDPNIRIVGLRTARELKLDVVPLVKALVKDSSPQVRRECAIALRHNESAEAPGLWTQLALQHDGQDRWYLEALGIGADKNEAKYFDSWIAAVGSNWNTPAGRDIIWRSRAPKAPALLVKIITDPKTTEAERPRYIRALDFITGPEKDAALLDLATSALK